MARNFLFDLLAPFYDHIFGTRTPELLVDVLDLPAGGRMLDAGGGTGRVSHGLASLVGELVLSDLSFPMLVKARQKTLDVAQSYAQALPFPENTFERILMVDALHHLNDQQGALRELLRVLKPGGRLVIEEPDINRLSVKLLAIAEKAMLMQSHFLSPQEIQVRIQLYGYSARIQTDGSFTAWVIVEK